LEGALPAPLCSQDSDRALAGESNRRAAAAAPPATPVSNETAATNEAV
jgi:hypothetical protein